MNESIQQNARPRRLLRDAYTLGDGWLQAPDHQDMAGQLQVLFIEDSFDELMAARFPMFLSRKLEGLDRNAGDKFVDEAFERGLMLADGSALPLMRRLRGLRLDVLLELADECECVSLSKMIAEVMPPPETPKERRARWLAMLEDEERYGRGARQRVADKVGMDAANLGKQLKLARKEQEEDRRGGQWTAGLVQDGKRKT